LLTVFQNTQSGRLDSRYKLVVVVKFMGGLVLFWCHIYFYIAAASCYLSIVYTWSMNYDSQLSFKLCFQIFVII
jgi:hypothetical protein